VLSDLHNEFRSFVSPEVAAEVTVLAGDIDIGKKGVGWAATAFAGRPVIYVAGNHEYYGRAIPKLTGELVELGESVGVTVLECASATVAGIRFLGCTLWSDFEIAGSSAVSMAACSEVMTDFRRIRVSPSFRRLRPADQRGLHQASVRWLRSELRAGDATRTVVVTHHAPSARSLDVGSRTDPVSGAYASDLEDLVSASGVPLWIHGHTHRWVDYQLGRTRVLSNPRGYPDQAVEGFQPDFLVEIAPDARVEAARE
jgi:predicted phosphodiesterase